MSVELAGFVKTWPYCRRDFYPPPPPPQALQFVAMARLRIIKLPTYYSTSQRQSVLSPQSVQSWVCQNPAVAAAGAETEMLSARNPDVKFRPLVNLQ